MMSKDVYFPSLVPFLLVEKQFKLNAIFA